MYDQIAARLAFGFHASEVSFSFCDAVVNDIHAVISLCNENRPNLFWEVFLAFDAGEFYPASDRDRDPVDTYTRPQIASPGNRMPIRNVNMIGSVKLRVHPVKLCVR